MEKAKEKEEVVVEAEVETEQVEKVIPEADELPKAIVRRVVKDKLSDCSVDGDLIVHKDALTAFSESARIFIHYLSATANDICKESKRQTIKAEDVLQALEEIEFPDLVGPLKASLTEFKRKNSVKKAGASESKDVEKKKKVEQGTPKKKKVEQGTPKKRKVEEETPKKSGEFKLKNSVKKAGASESKDVEKKKKVEQGTPKKRKVEEETPKKSGGKSKQKKKD